MVVYRAEFTARRQPGSVAQGPAHPAGRSRGDLRRGDAAGLGLPQRTGRSARPAGLDRQTAGTGGVRAATPTSSRSPVSVPPSWINTVVGLLFGLTLLAAIVALMRSQRRASVMSAEDEPRVRALVAESPEDSLAYFATRRDKSVVFAANGRSAITYRVDLGRLPGQQRPDRAAGSLAGRDQGLAGPGRHVRLDAGGDRGERGRRDRVRAGRVAGHPARRRGDPRDPGVPSRRPGHAAGPPGRAAAGADGLPDPGPAARRHPATPSWCN